VCVRVFNSVIVFGGRHSVVESTLPAAVHDQTIKATNKSSKTDKSQVLLFSLSLLY
jgi:hypothetical protein